MKPPPVVPLPVGGRGGHPGAPSAFLSLIGGAPLPLSVSSLGQGLYL